MLDRLWVSVEESVFSDSAGLILVNVPRETKSYTTEDTILSPKFAVGYQFKPTWSVELNWQFGPKESFLATNSGGETLLYAAVESRFLSALVAKEFSLPRNFTLEAKAGVTNSFFENSIKRKDTVSVRRWTIEETSAIAALGIRREMTPKLSAGVEFSNYLLEKVESVRAATFNLRYNF